MEIDEAKIVGWKDLAHYTRTGCKEMLIRLKVSSNLDHVYLSTVARQDSETFVCSFSLFFLHSAASCLELILPYILSFTVSRLLNPRLNSVLLGRSSPWDTQTLPRYLRTLLIFSSPLFSSSTSYRFSSFMHTFRFHIHYSKFCSSGAGLVWTSQCNPSSSMYTAAYFTHGFPSFSASSLQAYPILLCCGSFYML